MRSTLCSRSLRDWTNSSAGHGTQDVQGIQQKKKKKTMQNWPPRSPLWTPGSWNSLVNSLPPWAENHLSPVMAGQILRGRVGTARLAQYPVGARLRDIWLVLGGRGAGKTRLGAEWVNALVGGLSPFARHKYRRIALIGETLNDVREVMVEGPSGLLAVARRNRPRYEPSRRRVVWENGAVAQIFSATEPDSLRGPQFDAAWCDEVAKWQDAEACFDMLQFGLRLGVRPMQILTTTPRPVAILRRLLGSDRVTVTRMKTVENAGNLSAAFMEAVEQRYGGTSLGRQELDGEMVEERPG